MAKSIKLKNDIYLNSNSIVHNREKVSDIISSSLRTKISDNRLSDNETKTFTVRNGGVYLYINSHILSNCVLFIFTWTSNNVARVLEVASNSTDGSNPLPTLTLNGNELTIKANGHCRGYLYDILNQSSV